MKYINNREELGNMQVPEKINKIGYLLAKNQE